MSHRARTMAHEGYASEGRAFGVLRGEGGGEGGGGGDGVGGSGGEARAQKRRDHTMRALACRSRSSRRACARCRDGAPTSTARARTMTALTLASRAAAAAACAARTVVSCATHDGCGPAHSASRRRASEPALSHATAAGSAATTSVMPMLCAPLRSLVDAQDHVSRLLAELEPLQSLAPRARIFIRRAFRDRCNDRHRSADAEGLARRVRASTPSRRSQSRHPPSCGKHKICMYVCM